ncbi:hypothetical protein [uncultured Tessaracoccus sp.]|uniref:hypothetical protein n=1 Tax=uncultured Tessaracoccus sp. TaxID=905023 RepID=UPI00262C9078|nr:hypothetical protein [uncultured Tessaracoccus sp.]
MYTTLKRAVVAIVAAIVALAISLPLALANVLGGDTGAPQFAGVSHDTAGHDLGSFVVDGKRVYCIDSSGRGGVPFIALPEHLTAPNARVARTDAEHIAAYLLARYGNSTDAATAASVHKIVSVDAGLNSRADEVAWAWGRAVAAHPELAKRHDALVAEAKANIKPTLTVDISSDGHASTTLRSAAGTNLKHPVVLTLTGPARFANGTKTVTVTGSSRASVTFTGPGSVGIKARVTGLPSDRIMVYPSPREGVQRTVAAGAAMNLSASDPGIERPWTPRITTKANISGKAGATVSDTVRITGGKPGATIAVRSRLYGPLDAQPKRSNNAPANTPLLADEQLRVKLDNSGAATVRTKAVAAERAGWYTYDLDFAGDGKHTAFDAGYGVPAETGRITLWTPEAATQVSDQLVTGPDALTDTVAVSGGKPGARFTGTATLYGPFDTDPSEDSDLDLTKAASVGSVRFGGTYDKTGKATVTTPPVNVREAGFYVWAETINGVSGVSAEWVQPRAMPSETSVLTRPSISTQVSDQHALPGHTITDTVHLDGLVASVGGKPVTHTMTGRLYGPVAPVEGACEAVDWSDAPAVEFAPVEVEPGTGTIEGYGEHTITEPGCYTYAETLTSEVEGDDTPVVVEHEPGQPSQTAIVTEPTVSTTISAPVVQPGEPVTDTVTVANSGDTPWTIEAELWQYTGAESCEALTHTDWTTAIDAGAASAIERQTLRGTGDATVTTAPVTPTAPGCITWHTSAAFEGSSSAVVSEYGEPSESGVVMQPEIVTEAQRSNAFAGAVVHDNIRVTGTYGHPGTIKGKLLGPVAPVDGACEAVDWADAPVAGDIEPVRITGDGGYVSSKITTTAPGCYTFTEQLVMDNGVVVDHEPGIPSQTVLQEPPAAAAVAAETPPTGSVAAQLPVGGINAGEPLTSAPRSWLMTAGLGVLLLGAGVGIVGLMRRRS